MQIRDCNLLDTKFGVKYDNYNRYVTWRNLMKCKMK